MMQDYQEDTNSIGTSRLNVSSFGICCIYRANMPAKGSEEIPKSKSGTMSVKLQQKFRNSGRARRWD